jgi:Pvc16 N-terminal domain
VLHDLNKTLEKILIQKGNITPNQIDISFEQPNGQWSARLSRPTLDCWCFDLRENLKLRSMNMTTTRNGNQGRTTFAPRRFDLTYLITAWASKIEDEHQLLWRALAALKRTASIEPQDCEGLLRYQTHDVPLLVADTSIIPVNLVDLWGVLDNQMRLGFTLTTTVDLDVELALEAPLVLEATIRLGSSDDPARHELKAGGREELKIKPKPGQKPPSAPDDSQNPK